jgi:hypothetical protein
LAAQKLEGESGELSNFEAKFGTAEAVRLKKKRPSFARGVEMTWRVKSGENKSKSNRHGIVNLKSIVAY